MQSTTLHPIELGALLGIVLPVAVHYALVARRAVGVAASPGSRSRLIAGVLPLALSRTGVVAAVVGMSVFALGWTWQMRGRALVVVLVGLVVLRVAVPGLVGSLFVAVHQISEDTSTQVRQERYDDRRPLLPAAPVFGRGFNTLYPATQQVFDNHTSTSPPRGLVRARRRRCCFFIMPIFIARGIRLRGIDPDTGGWPRR